MRTYSEIVKDSYTIPYDEIVKGNNYKNISRSSIDKLKASMEEEIKLSGNPQIIPILLDAREGKVGTIIGGYHQHIAIGELIEENKWPYFVSNKAVVKADFVKPKDDKHAKLLALKHNTQYDLASKEQVGEWGMELVGTEYELSNLPILLDMDEVSMLDVMDELGPEENEKTPKSKSKEVECPSCGHKFEL